MEFGEVIFTVFLSAVINVMLIVTLYSKWIIPTIVERVRDELMTNIEKWIQQTRDDLGNTITINIDEMRQKLVNTISGYRGNKKRQLSLASQFLAANLDDPDNLESEESESVIQQAIVTYGEKIVKAALSSMRSQKAEASQNAEASPIW